MTRTRIYYPKGATLAIVDRATGRLLLEVAQPRTTFENALFASAASAQDGEVYVTVAGGAWSFGEP